MVEKKPKHGYFFYANPEIIESIRTLAYKTKRTQSDIVRDAIFEYLKKKEIQKILNESFLSKKTT